MGILNTTPDSFYDHGLYKAFDRAVARAQEMVEEGADLIDIGGEKAGPGEAVSVEEEVRRVVPVVKALRRQISLPLSVDTRRAEVARAAVAEGADIINSITGFEDHALRRVAAESGAAVVVMHIQGLPRVHHPEPRYTDITQEVRAFLLDRAETCRAEGIPPDRILIDPGIGFGKSSQHDIALLRDLRELTRSPYPVLLAASRKTFIGDILHTSIEHRLEGSLAVAGWGVLCGVRMVRVHDVRATKRVCRMTEAVLHPELIAPPNR